MNEKLVFPIFHIMKLYECGKRKGKTKTSFLFMQERIVLDTIGAGFRFRLKQVFNRCQMRLRYRMNEARTIDRAARPAM